jgi:hypothetical protein
MGSLFIKPASFCQRLTLRTMAVAARVVRDTGIAARRALIAVPAQVSGAALLDGTHHAALLW